ncbi:NUMOD4 motif-containing HNH endonuclease [Pseudomonas sp.]|uniref:NUMOD4 motif-containing HNH endonuclease n=1 Tax=Pseudomonas sp. TaxID=306 RepID=UPI003266A185
MSEVWKAIPGFETYYEVSSHGHVRSLDRRTTDCIGRPFVRYGKQIYMRTEIKGYIAVRLCVDTVHKTFKVHRLVAYAFLTPQPSPDHQINHINGVKGDNRVENLEWVSCSENVLHAFATGLCSSRKGSANSRSILRDDDVRTIRQLSTSGITCAAISRKYMVSEATIRNILKRRAWTHIA